jgi:prevent-host-death family protein
METTGIEEARIALGDIIDRARLMGDATVITRYGKPAAVVVPFDWYEAARPLLVKAAELSIGPDADLAAEDIRLADGTRLTNEMIPALVEEIRQETGATDEGQEQ